MNLDGYLNGFRPPVTHVLTDAEELMHNPLFWPAFLHTVGESESAPAAFDADPGDLDELVDAFLDPGAWPVFSLALQDHHHYVRLIVRNFPDDAGVDYLLDDGLPLAALEGHFRGPGLAWPELIAASEQPDPRHTAAERLLLLLPACADADRPSTAAETVAAAVTAVGARTLAREVAGELLDNENYRTHDCHWTMAGDALVCDGAHAYRKLGSSLTPAELSLITQAFRGAAR